MEPPSNTSDHVVIFFARAPALPTAAGTTTLSRFVPSVVCSEALLALSCFFSSVVCSPILSSELYHIVNWYQPMLSCHACQFFFRRTIACRLVKHIYSPSDALYRSISNSLVWSSSNLLGGIATLKQIYVNSNQI